MKNDGNSTTDLSTQSGFFVYANALRCSRKGASDAVGDRGDDPGGQRRQSMPLLLPATKTKIGDLLIDVSNFPSIRYQLHSFMDKKSNRLFSGLQKFTEKCSVHFLKTYAIDHYVLMLNDVFSDWLESWSCLFPSFQASCWFRAM
ncbi:hypothetical protein DAI22_08g070900 [Oryza sativa Japonica Group]|jgi:hypothetical protein|nr:hypothetical protein DAI22_08g070900 [Oryza sativa Japonica Group]